ncbi:MAG: ATP-binding protein [Gammaproteobacteria bacterium]|nr:ATP-binding protein [Gammaproteobacteria bacterium]
MYIPRLAEKNIEQALAQYPVVTILGPRQSGKSTLIKKLYPDRLYVNLEYPDERLKIEFDPRGFLASIPDSGVIIDEIQRLPALISYIQAHVDANHSNGLFILTGSHQLALHEAISQSLAGRTAIIKLLPLALKELESFHSNHTLDQLMWMGGYPKLFNQQVDVRRYYQDYLATYVERDVRQMIQLKDLNLFQKFLIILASRVGQLLDYQSISNDVGVSVNTIKQWCSILSASFVIFKLKPYFENIGKRLLKSPKIYFYDTGLLCALLGIHQVEQLKVHPLRGSIFENLAILEVKKMYYNSWYQSELFFYRDNHQHEVDLLLKQVQAYIPIEIKSSQTFHIEFLKGLKYLQQLSPDKFNPAFVIYAGLSQSLQNYKLLNIFDVYNELMQYV